MSEKKQKLMSVIICVTVILVFAVIITFIRKNKDAEDKKANYRYNRWRGGD